jgi:hypothetical protein
VASSHTLGPVALPPPAPPLPPVVLVLPPAPPLLLPAVVPVVPALGLLPPEVLLLPALPPLLLSSGSLSSGSSPPEAQAVASAKTAEKAANVSEADKSGADLTRFICSPMIVLQGARVAAEQGST